MSAEPIAVVADIHGNVWALEVVLADIHRRGISQILNLGDTVYGSLEPQATVDRLMSLPVVSVLGNEDTVLIDPPAVISPTVDFTLHSLNQIALGWFGAQTLIKVIDDQLLLCHGTPMSNQEYLLEDISRGIMVLRSSDEIVRRLPGNPPAAILCGHSHNPRVVSLPGGRVVINPGSVGLQAYTDDVGGFHKMETGSPHTRYAILTPTGQGWQVDLVVLPYPWEKAASTARKNGRMDWAAWLETGKA
ncbi:MAG TPA: metallophosphoesterase family protein [Longilinea sp.]|nr:metallophosphoesterase family protein [Longilinea sp.]